MQPPGGKYRYEEIVTRMLARLREEGSLTDVNPGSVTRTLVEAFGRELAETHARLSDIYEMGYIDTATGESLDSLVAIFGQRRIDGLRVVGEAVFTRAQRVAGRVVIPDGTRLEVGPARYVTTREAELQAGQSAVTVPVAADLAEGEEPTPHLLAGAGPWNATQAVPLAGIAEVTILNPPAIRGHKETDQDLRSRVKGLIDAAGSGTLKALEREILATRHAKGVSFRDANADGLPALQPGQLEVVVDGELDTPDGYRAIQDAINRAKGPGILVSVRGITKRTLSIQLKVLLAAPSTSASRKQALRRSIEQTVQEAIEGLKVGEPLLWNPVQARVLSLDGARDVLDGGFTLDQTPFHGLPRQIPPDGSDGLKGMERLVVPEDGPAVTVLFTGEATLQLRLWASVEPDTATRAAIARGVEQLLASKQGGGSISFDEVVAAARGVQGGTILEGAIISVQVIDLVGGGEVSLSPAVPAYTLGPDDRIEPHPDGPVWGDLS